jgi:hypothetical protein
MNNISELEGLLKLVPIREMRVHEISLSRGKEYFVHQIKRLGSKFNLNLTWVGQ